MVAPADEGITTDELMVSAGFEATALREALYLLTGWAFPATTRGMTAFLHVGVENASKKRFEAACALETALIAQLRETALRCDCRQRLPAQPGGCSPSA